MKKVLAVMLSVMLSASMLMAADTASLRNDFTDALASGDAAAAIESYEEMIEASQKAYQKAQRSYEKALDAGNMRKASEARSDMRASLYQGMTEEETNELLSLIIAEDGDRKAEDAQWLRLHSRYYSPSITYSWSTSGEGYSFSYTSSQTVMPGGEITLPDADDIRVNTAAAGVLTGWGVVPGEVTYQAGETIEAPYTDQTLYAVWETRVEFIDPVSGTESTVTDAVSGDTIAVPAVNPSDDSMVFAGWVDRTTGEYIAPDDTEVVLEGNGAIFEALWKNAEISDLEPRHYDAAAIPVNTQADLTFTLTNGGTEDLRALDIECTGDEGLTVLRGNGTIRSVDAGDSVTVQGIRIVGTAAGDHVLSITATDRDGDTWSADFTVTIV